MERYVNGRWLTPEEVETERKHEAGGNYEKEFAAFNYLLFPRHGDWAVMKISPGADVWQPGAGVFPEDAVGAGFFEEYWNKPVVLPP